ncbi:uroporphyrinogen decarboxylase 1, chloroplastic [Selaginella moellendorffii]|nr:uroporphyrinogen decarboxylase 1, chloroplastic [Selaginella moellendorffii]|eukprot:XP_002988044.2 uroporphyrinogen decarboxylase 1, chloroplastic [Selaginella moellendorffii]
MAGGAICCCAIARPTARCWGEAGQRPAGRMPVVARCESSSQPDPEPLLVQAARGQSVARPPAWMMRQAGRYMAAYRKLADKHPSFRKRSEETDLIVEISLQPWKAFMPDGVIIFSDILTPLPAIGVEFEIDDAKGPIISDPVVSVERASQLHSIDLSRLEFVGDSLRTLRREVGSGAAVLGFVGAPWTLATYLIEGRSTRTYKKIKGMCYENPELLKSILDHLANAIGDYLVFQIQSGAQCVQIFDSWGGQLTPVQWDRWSKPYICKMIRTVKDKCPGVPIVLYANGNGGLLERMSDTGAHVIGLDWTVDMLDGRKRLGDSVAVQGNVDPCVLFGPEWSITEAVVDVVRKAGNKGHILNLGHGVLVGTPEESVAHFFQTARSLSLDKLGSLSAQFAAAAAS